MTPSSLEVEGTATSQDVAVPAHDDVMLDWVTAWHDHPDALATLLKKPFRETRGSGVFTRYVRDARGTELWCAEGRGGTAKIILRSEPLEAWRRESNDLSLVRQFKEIGARVTRLDLARDVVGLWSANWLACAGREERIVSGFTDFPVGYQEDTDFSFYVGQSTSNTQLCVYGRSAHLEAKGVSDVPPDINRWEIHRRGDKAKETFEQIVNLPVVIDEQTGEAVWDLLAVHRDILGRMMRVTRRAPDRPNKNQSKAKNDPDWDAFVGPKKPVIQSAISREGGTPEDDARRVVNEFVRSSAPVLSAVMDAKGPEALKIIADLGRARRRPDVEALLKEHPKAFVLAIERLGRKPD
jgi:hypothetical protein